MEFKDRLKELRAETKTSATQLAHHLDKGESAVRMWESGRNKPDADTLITMARYFDCSTDYLLGLSNNKKEKPNEQINADMSNMTYDRNDPNIQAILNDSKFVGFMTDLIISLNKNKGIGTINLYEIFNVLLKDGDPYVFRIWKNDLAHISTIIIGLLQLEKMGERTRVEQVIANVRDLLHAAKYCHLLNDEILEK